MPSPFISSISISDFKNQFWKDFTFISDWIAGIYNTGDIVFYTTNNKFYTCLSDETISIPTTSSDWSLIDGSLFTTDRDISNAFNEAYANINDSQFVDNPTLKLGFLYLVAHYLVGDSRAGGLSSTGPFIATSRSVGNVSESYTLPDWATKSQKLSFYGTTYYGAKYLNLMLPLIGVVGISYTDTNPG